MTTLKFIDILNCFQEESSLSKQFDIVERAGLALIEIEFSIHQPDTEQEAASTVNRTFSYFYGLS